MGYNFCAIVIWKKVIFLVWVSALSFSSAVKNECAELKQIAAAVCLNLRLLQG